VELTDLLGSRGNRHPMTTLESRLDRIEAILERNSLDINTLTNRLDQVTVNAERDRQHFQNSITEINQQQAQLEAITIGFREISQRVDASIQQAASDRQQAAIDRQQFQNSISQLTQQFQTETRHIWEYLYLLQGRNGNSPQ